jgi:hypothetical protein
MPVMQVRVMRMPVHQPRMSMSVAMRLVQDGVGRVVVLVVHVMRVTVLVLHLLVGMVVLVPLG